MPAIHNNNSISNHGDPPKEEKEKEEKAQGKRAKERRNMSGVYNDMILPSKIPNAHIQVHSSTSTPHNTSYSN